MKEIPLSQGKVAIVDDGDYEWLSQWKWCYENSGYAVRSTSIKGGKSRGRVYMHKAVSGATADVEVDHINHVKLDNRRANLRQCTHAENCRNASMRRNNKSGYRGVCWHPGMKAWEASVRLNGKRYRFGYHATAADAAKAYDVGAKQLHGEFAHLNFPEARL